MRNARLDEAEAGRLPGELSITSDMQATPPLRQTAKRNERALQQVVPRLFPGPASSPTGPSLHELQGLRKKA